jgi:hypothetical protein
VHALHLSCSLLNFYYFVLQENELAVEDETFGACVELLESTESEMARVPLVHRKRGGRGLGMKVKRTYRIPTECRLEEEDLDLFKAQICCEFGKDMGELMKLYTVNLPDHFDLLIMDPPWHVTKLSKQGQAGVLFEWDKVTFL